ncbi:MULTISPECIES: DUF6555 family protein [Pseudomonas]|uniref:Uncharacterized protein n=1 Tax=Pseudomonas fluorescens TaxID=294 RepID=A0A5E7VM55_PSEFL|nr:DUF6555 family protein [Pseudomonas fluorescens]VVQ23752.1 hypothetical protein PS928_05613 [Pseudomonas fluorescens]
MNTDLYIIEYKLHGESKSFIIRTKIRSNADAWHWASCDAGLAPIPKPGRPPLKVVTKPQAEKYGLSDVRWRESAILDWTEVAT